MAINFPDSPVDGQEVTLANTSWMYSTSKSAWLRTSRGVTVDGLKVYNTISDLPLSGLTAGQQAFISSSNTYYVSNGSGWYSVTLVNTSPSITTVQDASANTTPFTLNTDGSTTVITVTATDPEDTPLIYSYSVTSGSLNGTTITQSSNVFTITPHASNAATFELTFTASDGVNTATSGANSFTLSFVSWSNATQEAKIQASDAQQSDVFGYSVSISGDGNTAIVGAYGEDTNGADAGAAYIFTRSGTTWSQEAKLQASDAEAGDQFSQSVSISSDGNTAIVGAFKKDRENTNADDNAGAAYIFTRSGTTWSQEAKLQASDAEAGDQFGHGVSISGDATRVIVGAYTEDTTATNAGSVYIFTRSGTTWSQEAKIQASDAANSDHFGTQVSIDNDGDTALVSAAYEDTGGSNAGAAYIFTRSGTTWSQQAKIQSSDIEATDYFGISVSISGDGNTALIGAYQEDTTATNAGSAYIFTRSGSTWSQEAKIQASDAAADDDFGLAVSISADGDTAIVGAEQTGNAVGSAYIFTRSGTTWSQQAKIEASDAQASDRFAYALAISGDGGTVLVGARGEDTTATGAGSAYIFVPG